MKSCGVLLPIFSLPNDYGIGSFGKCAYDFVDYIASSKQKYWQILPLVETGYGDSPYQSLCDKSFNPYFIDLDILCDSDLLTKADLKSVKNKDKKINYEFLYNTRFNLLKKAYQKFDKTDKAFKKFLSDKEYLDYALFKTLKGVYNTDWVNFPKEYRDRDVDSLSAFYEANKEEVDFWQFIQFLGKTQYFALKNYANKKGVKIIGDLPLYVAFDSVDVWQNPKNFMIGCDFKPTLVAGCPPDYFCATGQLWGNPCYNYDYMREHNFDFFVNRITYSRSIYDKLRVDHFRGLDRFWGIPYGDKTAENGKWYKACGREIFALVGTDNIIAEDLGELDEGVYSMMRELKTPGMRILSFAFEGDDSNLYLPWNIQENSITYTGTHDNDTLRGYFSSLNKETLTRVKSMLKKALVYLNIDRKMTGIKCYINGVIDICYGVKSNLVILPITDLMMLGSEYRINTPGLSGWWTMRLDKKLFTTDLQEYMIAKVKRFDR